VKLRLPRLPRRRQKSLGVSEPLLIGVSARIHHPTDHAVNLGGDYRTLRIKGRSFVPKVWKEGVYTVKVFDPDAKYEKLYRGRKATL